MQHYSAKDYKAGISNWDMTQLDNGLMFFANLSGVLRFDGIEWRLIDIKGGKLVRSIHKDSNERVFIGSNDEFGFLDLDTLGNISYTTLRSKLNKNRIGQILQIVSIKNDVYFLTRDFLIRYNQTGLKTWETNRAFGAFTYNNFLYVKQNDQPLLKLKNDTLVPLSNLNEKSPALIRNNIVNGVKPNEKFLISIRENQGYIFKNDSLFSNDNSYPFGNSILSLTKENYKNNSFWVSTVNNGIFNFNYNDSIFNQLNIDNGLPTQINININSDKQFGIWSMHQKGITRIQSNKQIMYWSEKLGIDEPINNILNINGQLFLATFNGLYTFDDHKKLYLIDKSEGRLFNLINNKSNLYAFGDNGIYKFNNTSLTKKIPSLGISNSFKSSKNKLLLTSYRDGIIKYNTQTEESSNYIPDINGICNSILSLDSIHWLSYKSEGIYLINENNGHPKWEFFNQKHGLPDVSAINILKTHDDEILFSTTKGFYTLNKDPKTDSSDLFMPYTKITSEKLNINNIDQDKFGNYWITVIEESQKQSVIKYERQKDGSYLKITQALKAIPNQTFSTIYVDEIEDSIIWIAGNEGLYRFNDGIRVNYNITFNTYIKEVSLGDSIISTGLYKTYRTSDSIPTLTMVQNENNTLEIPFHNNNIKFGFSALFYEQPKRNQYSYKLEGFDKKWSSWTSINNKEYTNLPAGNYTFKVKSKNLYDVKGATATYTFSILPPWYQTTWAYLIFSVITVGIIWFLMLAYTYRVRQHRKKLKLIVADRTFEVMQQKRVIEKQLLKMQNLNEEISQQRDDILEKNEELESSQQKIITTNEKLQELNHALEERVEKRTAKIKDTIRKLQQTNKDLDTFTYKTSHDLKGPISRIKGILALARYENPEAKSDKYLDLIEKTTKEMDILLAKLTQVHNIYNSKIEYNSIDIPTVFRDVMDRISPLVQQSQFKFKFDLQNENELKTDVKMLELILLNLLENALTYFDDDKPQKEIKLSTIRKANTFYLSIEDNGIGIPEKQLPKIFEMFYRGSEKSIGNGLGLYLVKVAVEKIGAKLECESEEHNFTRIIIKFPLNKE